MLAFECYSIVDRVEYLPYTSFFSQMNSHVLVMASVSVCPVYLDCAATPVLLSTTGILQGRAVYNVSVISAGLSERTVMILDSARVRQTLVDSSVIDVLMVTMALKSE